MPGTVLGTGLERAQGDDELIGGLHLEDRRQWRAGGFHEPGAGHRAVSSAGRLCFR